MKKHWMGLTATFLLLVVPTFISPVVGEDSGKSAPIVVPSIRLPETLPLPPSPSPPLPVPVTKLSAGQLYVVSSDTDILLVASRDGLVKITPTPTPITLYGNFVDGGEEVRVYKTGKVYIVRAISVGQVELIIASDLTGSKLIRRVLDVDDGKKPIPPPEPPIPPTPPIPPKPPEPPTPPAPIPTAGFRVLILEETADRSKLPPAQLNILFSKTIRDYFNSKCVMGPDGKTKEWRIWDVDTSVEAESQVWKEVMKRPHPATPWLIVSNPEKGKGFEGPLPESVDKTMELLKKLAD